MPETESRRLALYNGLRDLLGAELADTLMNSLPVSTDVATKTDIRALKTDIRGLKKEMVDTKTDIRELRNETKTDIRELKSELKDDFSRLSERMDKMQHTMVAGFIAVVVAVVGSGLVG